MSDPTLPIADQHLHGLRLLVRRDTDWGGVEVVMEHGTNARSMQQIAALDLTWEEARWLRDTLSEMLDPKDGA